MSAPAQTPASRPWPMLLRGWLALLCCALLAGCPTVQFISDYDVEIDHGITAFQKQIERHLAVLERSLGSDAAGFARHEDFYDSVRIDLRQLRTRAEFSPKNELTVEQLDKLIRQVDRLVALHREGLAANDFPPLRTAFATTCTAVLKLELAKKRDQKPPG